MLKRVFEFLRKASTEEPLLSTPKLGGSGDENVWPFLQREVAVFVVVVCVGEVGEGGGGDPKKLMDPPKSNILGETSPKPNWPTALAHQVTFGYDEDGSTRFGANFRCVFRRVDLVAVQFRCFFLNRECFPEKHPQKSHRNSREWAKCASWSNVRAHQVDQRARHRRRRRVTRSLRLSCKTM